MKERYLLKARGRLGPDARDHKEIRILNRIIEWAEEGIWYEADQRHADIIVRDIGILERSKSLSTPGEKQGVVSGNADEEQQGNEATLFRALTARGLYLAQDRSDIPFAVKNLNRKIGNPPTGICNH